VVLGKYMRLLLIVLDISLIAYTISHIIYHVLPVTEPTFWVGAIIEVGIAYLAFRFWMRSREAKKWNSDRWWTLLLVVLAIFWPVAARYTDFDMLKSAATADLLFFGSALTLLIYSSFVVKPDH
jgi:hypothetical protein